MSLINLSMKHNTTLAEAEAQLAETVATVEKQFGSFVHTVEWDRDRRGVKFTGPGAWVTMKVDAEHVHAAGDIPVVSRLLGGAAKKMLEGTIKKQFPKALPEK